MFEYLIYMQNFDVAPASETFKSPTRTEVHDT